MHNLSILFEVDPQGWSLRGDAYLWAALKEHYTSVQTPATGEAFRQTFFEAFKVLTGNELDPFTDVYVERLNHGGMSGGWVCAYHWYCRLLPELTERFLAYLHNPSSPRIFSCRTVSRTRTNAEEEEANKLLRMLNAIQIYKRAGIKEVKNSYPEQLSFVNSVSSRNLKATLFVLHAQLASLS